MTTENPLPKTKPTWVKNSIIVLLILGYYPIFGMGFQAGESHTFKYMCPGLSRIISSDEPLPPQAEAIAQSLRKNCFKQSQSP